MQLKSISPAQTTRLINDHGAALFDMRSHTDFKEGHIINAKNIPENEFTNALGTLKKYKQKSIIVYCNSGAVSPHYARRLIKMGFPQTYYLKGGLVEWKNARLPLSKEKLS